jgi:Zn-dependent peptidase ImmA (M78 family)
MLLPAERRIFANAGEPTPRRRFTLAHEVGHWVCQCLEGGFAPVYCRASDVTLGEVDQALEREANVFAAELLMPELQVRRAFGASTAIDDLAARFDVSTIAMQWRLFNFGLVAEPPA